MAKSSTKNAEGTRDEGTEARRHEGPEQSGSAPAPLPGWAEPDPDRDQPTVAVHLPVQPVISNATAVHLEVRLGADQSRAFRAVKAALLARRTQLLSGRPVVNDVDVVRFIFDSVADRLQRSPGLEASA